MPIETFVLVVTSFGCIHLIDDSIDVKMGNAEAKGSEFKKALQDVVEGDHLVITIVSEKPREA